MPPLFSRRVRFNTLAFSGIICVFLTACGGGTESHLDSSFKRQTLSDFHNGAALLLANVSPETRYDTQTPAYEPLAWPDDLPEIHYTLSDGTRVTRVGGRVRDRHAREGFVDNYNQFPAHYFEKRTHEIIIYDNVDSNSTDHNNPDHILTVVVRPQYWMFDVNFRHGYHGSTFDPNAYVDNSNMKTLDTDNITTLLDGKDLTTPLNYAGLGYDILNKEGKRFGSTASGSPDFDPCNGIYSGVEQSCQYLPDGRFVMVKEIRTMANQGRALKAGDLVEFEIGIFLAGEQSHRNINSVENRWNYYAETMMYKVGHLGMVPWMRQGGVDTATALQSIEMPTDARSGGDLTLHENTSFAEGANKLFMQASTNIADYHMQPWVEGRRLFHVSYLTGTHTEKNNPIFKELFGQEGVDWIQGKTSYDDIDIKHPKVGPLFSQTRCFDCHTSNGRSSPQFINGINLSLSNMGVFTGAEDSNGNQIPHPEFGTRLQQGLGQENAREAVSSPPKVTEYDAREATLTVKYLKEIINYPDGKPATLHKPVYTLTAPGGQDLVLPARLSVRAAPHVIGMGLLEAVDEKDTLEKLVLAQKGTATPGKLQIVTDPDGIARVGRFGWKAGAPSVAVQVSAAFNTDMGVTTPLFPKHECALGYSPLNKRCASIDNSNPPPKLSAGEVENVNLYLRLLGVPPARLFVDSVKWLDPAWPGLKIKNPAELATETQRVNDAKTGQLLFSQAQCIACHVDTIKTGNKHRFRELRNQTIHPYSDLLLHDMGAALADTYIEGRAKGSEWRTAPLWGIGLLSAIDPNVRYLHDGRAATLEEAILWHGGQATASRYVFMNYSATQRAQLIEFLKSL